MTGSYGAGLARHLTSAQVAGMEVEMPKRRRVRPHGKFDPVDAELSGRPAEEKADEATSVPKKSADGLVIAHLCYCSDPELLAKRSHTGPVTIRTVQRPVVPWAEPGRNFPTKSVHNSHDGGTRPHLEFNTMNGEGNTQGKEQEEVTSRRSDTKDERSRIMVGLNHRFNRSEHSWCRSRKEREMVRISVQVSSGAARFRVAVHAESIERALEIAKSCNPGKDCEVTFPIDPERFFVKDPAASEGLVEFEKLEEKAA